MNTNVMMCLAVALLAAGCTGGRALKPGRSAIQSSAKPNGIAEFKGELKQPENPAQQAAQNFERATETELPLAAGTKIAETVVSHDDKGKPVTKEKAIVLTEPTVQTTRVTEKAGTVIGAAQEDKSREIGAKLASLKGIVWVGVGLFVFGLASLVYPPLKLVIGSVTTSAAIAVGGVALMVLPTLIVGNELMILAGVGVAVGGWFLAHRHGRLQGLVDANKNGIDDRLEKTKAGEV